MRKYGLISLLIIIFCIGINLVIYQSFSSSIKASSDVYGDAIDSFENVENTKKLYLLLIHSYDFKLWEELTQELTEDALNHLSFAGMSLRTASGIGSYHNLFSLYTGAHLQGLKDWSAYMQDEEINGIPASKLYREWYGKELEGEIIHPYLQHWLKQNQGAHAGLPFGWLREQLLESGVVMRAYGNGDTRAVKKSWGPLFISNANGEAAGIIDQRILQESPYFPGGVETNWTLLNELVQLDLNKQSSSFYVFEIGDYERINDQQQYLMDERVESLRKQVTAKLSHFIEQMMDIAKSSDHTVELWLVAPSLSTEAMQQEKHLAPFAIWSSESLGGILSSASTKQHGLVSNLDLMPSLIHFFQLQVPHELPGNIFVQNEGKEELVIKDWLNHYEYLFTVYKERRPILTKYISWVIALLLGILVYFWAEMKIKLPGKKVVRVALAALLLTPLMFLYLTPLIKVLSHNLWLIVMTLCALSISVVLEYLFKESQTVLVWVASLTALALAIDIVLGAPFMQRSFIGYDPLIGARYYGIGNEYAGVFIGSTILSLTALRQFQHNRPLQRIKDWVLPLALSLFIILMWIVVAAPMLGANFGASIAAGAGFFMVILALFNIKLNPKRLVILSLVVFIGLLGVFYILHSLDSQTHIGRAINQLFYGTEGLNYLGELLTRKWEMNVKLIKRSLWGKLFFTLLLILVVLFIKRREIKRLNTEQQNWYTGLRISTFSAFFLLLVNDSGIVSAATALLYATLPLLYISFQKETQQQQSNEELKIES